MRGAEEAEKKPDGPAKQTASPEYHPSQEKPATDLERDQDEVQESGLAKAAEKPVSSEQQGSLNKGTDLESSCGEESGDSSSLTEEPSAEVKQALAVEPAPRPPWQDAPLPPPPTAAAPAPAAVLWPVWSMVGAYICQAAIFTNASVFRVWQQRLSRELPRSPRSRQFWRRPLTRRPLRNHAAVDIAYVV